ncbi:hypothetical protein FOZ60_010058 [Perkinsus olseni]|uniref:Uncharacterized protein n=1 Tax=Perkinsus olseni TaxID=32597 RepID=A0A7J6NH75_PEROL|nr:hypothetical protein FOZ60_010058 [Perkinsus olseni]KAF4703567.1 hypothetical protein FOZ62_023335 [Perkinsus olseni]
MLVLRVQGHRGAGVTGCDYCRLGCGERPVQWNAVAGVLDARIDVHPIVDRLQKVDAMQLSLCLSNEACVAALQGMDCDMALRVHTLLASSSPRVYAGTRTQPSSVRRFGEKRVPTGGKLRVYISRSSTYTYGPLRKAIRVVGSRNRQIPTVDPDTISAVVSAAHAPSTARKYNSVLSRYESLMVRMQMEPWPVRGISLVTYITALTREAKVQFGTIKDYVQKVRCAGVLEHGRLSDQESELVPLAQKSTHIVKKGSEGLI